MLDLAHSTYSLGTNEQYWDRQLRGDEPCTILLAMEVEWGNRYAVLEDATKIAAVRGSAKVLVSGLSASGAHSLAIDLQRLRRLTNDQSPWLWVNLAEDHQDIRSEIFVETC